MSRYTETDALIDRLDFCVKEGMGSKIAYTFKHMVDEAPSIDIVFCKECKYEKRCTTNVHFLADNGLDVIPVRFCSYGEREDE